MKTEKLEQDSSWMVDCYSGVAVHVSGFSLFITDNYSRVTAQQYKTYTAEYVQAHGLTLAQLFTEGKQLLLQSLVNKAYRLQIDMNQIRQIQKRHKETTK
jgi:hypothetical protein